MLGYENTRSHHVTIRSGARGGAGQVPLLQALELADLLALCALAERVHFADEVPHILREEGVCAVAATD